jgi:hypothetical protein
MVDHPLDAVPPPISNIRPGDFSRSTTGFATSISRKRSCSHNLAVATTGYNVERRGLYLKLIARRLRQPFPGAKRVGAFWGGEKGEARTPGMFPDLDLQPLPASLEETLTLFRSIVRQSQAGSPG